MWADIIKLKAKNKCQLCGNKNRLHSHHIFGRKNSSTRWHIINGICLCFKCHKFAHSEPKKFVDIVTEIVTPQRYKKVSEIHNQIAKISKFELEILYDCLTALKTTLKEELKNE